MTSSPQAVAYVFHGQDEPGLKDRLAAFCGDLFADPMAADLNTTRLESETVQPGDIEAAAGTLPFMSDVRLVLVENVTDANLARDLIDRIPDLIPALPDSTRLVFVETGVQGHTQDSPAALKRKTARRAALKKLINAVENDPRGKILAFDLPRDPGRWITERAAQHRAAIEPGAARLLAERIGSDLTLADTELAKLATYTNGERPISAEDVDLLTPYSPEASIFHMVDALGQRRGKAALSLLHRLIDDGDEPLRIFGMIVRQYRLLIQMREHLDGGQPASSAPQALGVRDFVARKLAGQARQYRLDQLERIYHFLLETDLSIKTGEIEPQLALESFIARLSRGG
jgi:DNA polymerase-3 subunit delta